MTGIAIRVLSILTLIGGLVVVATEVVGARPIVAPNVVGAGPDEYDYPSRPHHVRVAYETGILMEYVLGIHGGGITIRLRDGMEDHFDIASPNKIDGHHYRCQDLPFVRTRPPDLGVTVFDPALCYEKPKNVLVGKTRVRVAYWRGWSHGQLTKISDEIWTVRS